VKFNGHTHHIFHANRAHVPALRQLVASLNITTKPAGSTGQELMSTLCHSEALEKQT
jgi:hypothetical protein